jgi:hypothetical protein
MKVFDLSIYEDEEDFFDDEDFTEVTREKIEDQRRWSTMFSQVFKYKDGTFWEASWERGSTEYQETDLELSVVQVEPVQVTVTKYKVIK